jgi:thiamine biosynthesis lipoprotein
MSTSGEMYQSVDIGGKTYSHIVDPKTGIGLTNHNRATVIAPDGTTADALATALTVMSPEKGMALIDRIPHSAARIHCIVDGKEFVRDSRQFRKWLKVPK